jgi:hypothetical protein
VKWELSSRGDKYKGDNSLRSFLFTLRNTGGVPPRKFVLKEGEKHRAIWFDSGWGPTFGEGCISVPDNCNTNTISNTYRFGSTYDSMSGEIESDFLTGTGRFTVTEIEVFEIAD